MSKTPITEELLAEQWRRSYIYDCFSPCEPDNVKVGIWWRVAHKRWDLSILAGIDTPQEKSLRFVGIEYMEDITACLRLCGLDELADKLINDKI